MTRLHSPRRDLRGFAEHIHDLSSNNGPGGVRRITKSISDVLGASFDAYLNIWNRIIEYRGYKMSVHSIPSPGKSNCPVCGEKELFVPIYVKKGDNEIIFWQCASCGYSPRPKVDLHEYPGGDLFLSEE
jgi:rubredoxin